MSDIAIKVEDLSKLYQLGEIGTGTLSRDLERWWARTRGKEDPFAKIGQVNDRTSKAETGFVWALKDINFEVKKGEVLGIIGRNGAGKSTLLKILSKITAPSTGKIYLDGRIASLLEVGTGFHPEMTGRENIFMNGAILGMRKKEIQQKFDAIVDFAGVEKYIDTPVKRYSSGMYVRLAFAVAAFLEPEILIVDEVLAVGDAEFQKKCLGRMKDVSVNEGRTVLFVSHNMGSIKNLCDSILIMEKGTANEKLSVNEGISKYLKATEDVVIKDVAKEELYVDETIQFDNVQIKQAGEIKTVFNNDEEIKIEIDYTIKQKTIGLRLILYFYDKFGNIISQNFHDEENDAGSYVLPGNYQTSFLIPPDLFLEGDTSIRVCAGIHGVRICKPHFDFNLNILETGKLKRKRFSELYKGLVTLPVVSNTFLKEGNSVNR